MTRKKKPRKQDILKDKPLKKHDLLIRMMDAVSPIRNPQYGEAPSRKPDGPWQEFGYWQEKQKHKK